jgi:hypothetical protein
MANYSTKQIIDYAMDDNGAEFRKELYASIHDKVTAHIEAKKQEVAENLLGLNDNEEEEFDGEEEQEEVTMEEEVEELEEADGPGRKWRQGYSASGHPAGYKHKSGEIGPIGGSWQVDDEDEYVTKKRPVNKHRDERDTLAGRKSVKQFDRTQAGTPYKNPQVAVDKFKHQIRSGMKRHHGPVGKLPEEVDGELEEGIIKDIIDKGRKLNYGRLSNRSYKQADKTKPGGVSVYDADKMKKGDERADKAKELNQK